VPLLQLAGPRRAMSGRGPLQPSTTATAADTDGGSRGDDDGPTAR